MSNFTALNVVYEDESEDEIDGSKELQIEEALKLYQNALKLHSQGPAFYDEAEAAYKELFSSEVFTYAESLSESRWLELYGDADLVEDVADEDAAAELPTAVASGEGAPSTLPQVLYLAYKNHGQFRLDRLKEQLLQIEQELQTSDRLNSPDALTEAASVGLQHLAEALDRDESDLDLWRKVARVGQYLGGQRIARFCLETVLDNEGTDPRTVAEPVSLEQIFATEQLLPLLDSISDHMAQDQTQHLLQGQQNLAKALRRHIDPFPHLPVPDPTRLADPALSMPPDQEIKVLSRTWASCGAAILSRLTAEHLHEGEKGAFEFVPGANYFLTFSSKDASEINEAPLYNTLIGGTNDQPPSLIAHRSKGKPAREDTGSHHIPEGEFLESPTKFDNDGLQQVVLSPISIPHSASGKDEIAAPEATADELADIDQGETTTIAAVGSSSRKRSSETAELVEGAEIGRSRSKRIKTRGSIADPAALKDTTADDWTKWYKQQLEIYVQADDIAFKVARKLMLKLGCKNANHFVENEQLKSSLKDADTEKSPVRPADIAAQDVKTLLLDWDLAKSKLFLRGDNPQVSTGVSSGLSNAGFSTFLTQPAKNDGNLTKFAPLPNESGLEAFINNVQQSWTSLNELAFRWIRQLLEHQPIGLSAPLSLYDTFLWSEDLKKTVVLLLVHHDDFIYKEMSRSVDMLLQPVLTAVDPELQVIDMNKSEDKRVALVQTIFELHLDIYSIITNPNSDVDMNTRTLQRDRVARWATLASTVINDSSWSPSGQDCVEPRSWQLMYRFLWASVVCNDLLDPSASQVTVAYFQHLIQQLKKDSQESASDLPVIYLPNNAVMPEISIDAAEKEVSRLTSLEFFTSIFSSEDDDPVSVIEKLEPLLLLSVRGDPWNQGGPKDQRMPMTGEGSHEASSQQVDLSIVQDPRLSEALQLLDRASLPMSLILWQRLQDAYSIVNYPPQILACNLWSLIMIVRHLESSSYLKTSKESRQESILRWLNKVDELMTQILALASTNPLAFECVDQEQVLSSMEAVAGLQEILYVFGTWEDTVRVGQAQSTPQPSSAALKAQLKSVEKFREMMVKTWTLQYILIKEGVVQITNVHVPDDELLSYLKVAHNMLGLRAYCGLANKMFLKLAKTELLRMQDVEGWDSEMPQVVSDLYGLKISSIPADMQDHSCEPTELDRSTALEILDLVLVHVDRLSIKDLLKNDLRFAVDKMQSVIKVPKAAYGSIRSFNKRLMISYLKSPISSVALNQSIRGIGELCSTSARTEGYDVAAKGWYFLLGHIALTKFRTQKRITAGSMEDLENAKMFFRQDLEFDTERWETWYRLAQTFDTQIDEYTTWTADKLENDQDGLVDLQRMAILCYIMAVAAAKRSEKYSLEDYDNMATLSADFGIRIYASTREPFNARAFALDDFKKRFSGTTRGMYEDLPFKPVSIYSAWKFASRLLKQAAQQKPHDWYISYMLAKVFWKMHNCPSEIHPPVDRIDSRLAIDAILRAIKYVPEKRDSRHSDKDPVLEPHYKLVSIVHKLVRSKRPGSIIGVEKACHILKATSYSRKVPDVQDSEDWEQYVLAVLKAMRSADKSNWHHRMVMRSAHIIYDENPNDMLAVLGAKHELSQQIFTRTMTIQVWKPDNERAGRHFVYTGRDGMEMLARRIRRKAGDFANHTTIWRDYSMKYLELLRKSIPVPRNYDEFIFGSMNPEEFSAGATRLEAWVLAPGTVCQHIDILRETMEYKKINNNLMDRVSVEGLIVDIYAWIYHRNVDELKAKETAEENRVRMRVDNILTNQAPAPLNTYGPPAEPPGAEQHGRGIRRQFSVTRRMIVLRAEALIVKPPAIATPKPAPRTLAPAPIPGQTPALAVVIPPAEATVGEAISVPGSVHDSADDESELSDVENLVEDPDLTQRHQKKTPQRPFFPNLLGATADEDAESTIGDEGGNGTANDEDDGAEEDIELESEAEKEQVRGHVPSGGFGSVEQLEEDKHGEEMEM